ncbi:hypothetical protein F4809DRAFT_171194 [Biscogniauxia mediterranea]|nr:hypothetical protein F4809DRAFT_171194 [Biscogniauxia mediterranea]
MKERESGRRGFNFYLLWVSIIRSQKKKKKEETKKREEKPVEDGMRWDGKTKQHIMGLMKIYVGKKRKRHSWLLFYVGLLLTPTQPNPTHTFLHFLYSLPYTRFSWSRREGKGMKRGGGCVRRKELGQKGFFFSPFSSFSNSGDGGREGERETEKGGKQGRQRILFLFGMSTTNICPYREKKWKYGLVERVVFYI